MNRRLLLSLGLLLAPLGAAAADRATVLALAEHGVFRHASVEQAWRTAAAAKRPLVVMFTSANCPHCDRMLAETYGNPAIQRLLTENAETVLADDAAYHKLAAKLGIRAYPTTIVVSGEGKIVDAVEGYVDAAKFAQRILPWLAPQTAEWRPAMVE